MAEKEASAPKVKEKLNPIDRRIALEPEQLGPGWVSTSPDNLKLTDERKHEYREVKAFSLEDAMSKRAQLLIVLFYYGDEGTARDAYKEIGHGLESEMPKNPGIGDESIIYELDMRPMVQMRICALRVRNWLAIFTLWMFQDFELEDAWIKNVMTKQLERLKK